MHGNDRSLVADVLAGNEASFRALYRRHAPRLYQLALRLSGGDRAAAEDALQESWIAAIAGLERFRWESCLATWLGGILVRKTLSARRVMARRSEVEVGSGGLLGRLASVPTESVAERLDLERAIATLPEGRRTVFVLYDIEGFKHTEIGLMLGISEGTSKSQLHEARRTLTARLGLGTPEPSYMRHQREREGGPQ